MFFRVLEVAGIVFAAYLILSQIILPATRGTLLFPWFRRERKLRDDIAQANQKLEERELEELLEARRRAGLDTLPPPMPPNHTSEPHN